ncbi:hypothetical protein ELBR111191_14635 [Elizabethkingia bruuniana]
MIEIGENLKNVLLAIICAIGVVIMTVYSIKKQIK